MPELGAATSTQHTQPPQSYSGNCRVGQQGWLLNPCQIDLVLLFPNPPYKRAPFLQDTLLSYWNHSQAPAWYHSPATASCGLRTWRHAEAGTVSTLVYIYAQLCGFKLLCPIWYMTELQSKCIAYFVTLLIK